MNGKASTPLTDRRRVERLKTLLETLVAHGDPATIAPCRILDLSSAGALIELDPTIVLFRPIRLLLPLDGVACDAQVAWRSEGQVGLAFRHRFDLTKPAPKTLESLQAAWNEMRAQGRDG